MNKSILIEYGISFSIQSNGNIKTTAHSPNLDMYIYMYSKSVNELIRFVNTMDTALDGNYSLIGNNIWSGAERLAANYILELFKMI